MGRYLRGWKGGWGYRVVGSRVECVAVHTQQGQGVWKYTCIAIPFLGSEWSWLVTVTFRVFRRVSVYVWVYNQSSSHLISVLMSCCSTKMRRRLGIQLGPGLVPGCPLGLCIDAQGMSCDFHLLSPSPLYDDSAQASFVWLG